MGTANMISVKKTRLYLETAICLDQIPRPPNERVISVCTCSHHPCMPLNHRAILRLSLSSITVHIERPALLVTRRVSMMRRISAAGEVIEDSEPEREERRRQDKEEKEKKKTLKLMRQQATMNREQIIVNVSEVSVIDLSGSF